MAIFRQYPQSYFLLLYFDKCGSYELCKFINIWTAFCHSPLILYAHMVLLPWRYIYYMRMTCIFAYVFPCMHACAYFCFYALIDVYECTYMCTLMFLILICVCILSSFRPHDHHLSPDSPRLMFLFVDCATVNKVYLILTYFTELYFVKSNIPAQG